MKKTLLSLIIPFAVMLLAGCFEDNGNYDYDEAEVITVTGIQSSYSIETKIQRLSINPVVESNKPAEWEYSWGYVSNSSVVKVADTKDLSHIFTMGAGSWSLIFSAKNTLTGVEKIVRTSLGLVTSYSRGWYVLKDDGANADLDLFPASYMLIPDPLTIPDVLKLVNGTNLKGKGVKYMMTASFSLLNSSGSFSNTRSLVVLSEEDLGVYRIENLNRERDGSNISFAEWPVIAPGMYFEANSALSLLNDGRFYAISTMSSSTGRFGMPQALDDAGTDYRLAPYVISGTICFDEQSSSFVNVGSYGVLSYCIDAAGTEVSAKNNGLTCLYMGSCLSTGGIGVFADKATGERKILRIPWNGPPIKIVSTLTAADKLNDATIMMAANEEEVMFFVDAAGDVYSRLLNSSGTEMLEFDVPNDETVTFIRQVRHNNSSLPVNYIAVGTSKGSGSSATYTIRFFAKLGGRFNGENEDIRLTGNGYPRDVNFINPSLTYLNTYYSYLYR